MNFGNVTPREINKIDFSLPPEPLFNKAVLKGKKVKDPAIYIGCAKWGRSEWVGKLYPLKTKEKDFLEHYVQHYNSIELNATHYKVYTEPVIQQWAVKAGDKNFRFCPKMYKGVSHFGNLTGKDQLVTDFLKGVLAFRDKLGPVFIQVSERFSTKRQEELFSFLRSLPTDLQFFMEVRHPSWFADVATSEAYFATLRSLNIGAVITDASGRRDCVHMHLPVAKTFIRFVGNSLHKTDYTRIDEWVKRIHFWLSKGLKELYFFMHMHEEAKSPELTVYLVDQLNAVTGLKLGKPVFISKKKTKSMEVPAAS